MPTDIFGLSHFPKCFLNQERKKNYLCQRFGFWYTWICILNGTRDSHSKRPTSKPGNNKHSVSVDTASARTPDWGCFVTDCTSYNDLTVCENLWHDHIGGAACKRKWCGSKGSTQGEPCLWRRPAWGLPHQQVCLSELPILLGTGMSVIISTLTISINGHFSCKSAILNYSVPCFAELPCFALYCLSHLCFLSFNANIALFRKVSQCTSVG